MLYNRLLYLTLITFFACSTNKKVITEKSCSNDCEIKKYESLLTVMGQAKDELLNGHSFRALKLLESIKKQAYYHGQYKFLHKSALKIGIKSTNSLTSLKNSCSIIRNRVFYLKSVSPDHINKLAPSIDHCKIDISSNTTNFDISKVVKSIELTSEEIKNLNIFELATKYKNLYNSNPWQKLLLIDLKILSQYSFKVGTPELQKEMPHNAVRFKIPLEIIKVGDMSYCQEYSETLHDISFSNNVVCKDYSRVKWSDLKNIFKQNGESSALRNNIHVKTFNISSEISKYIKEFPFTKEYKYLLAIKLKYNSKEGHNNILNLSYPNNGMMYNLLARLDYMDKGLPYSQDKVEDPMVIIKGKTDNGIDCKIQTKKEQGINFSLSGNYKYEIDINIPDHLTRDLKSIEISTPIKQIFDYFTNLAKKVEPISGAKYPISN